MQAERLCVRDAVINSNSRCLWRQALLSALWCKRLYDRINHNGGLVFLGWLSLHSFLVFWIVPTLINRAFWLAEGLICWFCQSVVAAKVRSLESQSCFQKTAKPPRTAVKICRNSFLGFQTSERHFSLFNGWFARFWA